MNGAKITIELTFADFNALDILVNQEILRINSDLVPGDAARPAVVAWRNRLRVMQENIAAMRPPAYAEQIRQAHDSRLSVCDA